MWASFTATGTPMNRSERLHKILTDFGGKARLGTILEVVRDDGSLIYKLTAAMSELRADLRSKGKDLVCTPGPTPSENLYEIKDLDPAYVYYKGQGEMVLK